MITKNHGHNTSQTSQNFRVVKSLTFIPANRVGNPLRHDHVEFANSASSSDPQFKMARNQKKLKKNNHRPAYPLWKKGVRLPKPEDPASSCPLYTDVSLAAGLDPTYEKAWPPGREIMLDDY